MKPRLTKLVVGIALAVFAIEALSTAYSSAQRPSLEGVHVGMSEKEFEALNLPHRFLIGSGPMARYSAVFVLQNGQHLATVWDMGQSPSRLLGFKLSP